MRSAVEQGRLARTPQAAPAARAHPAAALLQLQRSAGNSAVARAVLARRWDRKAYDQAIAEKEHFTAWTWEAVSHRPSTGLGNFDALYEPKAGTLTVTVKCDFRFEDGKESDFEDTDEGKAGAHWDDKAKKAWKAEFLRRVSAFWSDRFVFHCTRDWWEDLQATVKVRFVETPKKDAHYVVHVKKVPELEDRRSKVRAPKTHGKRGSAFLDSEDLIQNDGQTPIYHEAGHMLGLGDEYPKKTDKPVAHEKLVQAEFKHGVVRKRDNRLMSDGNEVRPEYGVTFLEALRAATGIQEWRYDAKPPAPVLSDPVDGPMPKPVNPLQPSAAQVA